MGAEISAIELSLVAAFQAMPGRGYYRLAAGLKTAAHHDTSVDTSVTAILNEAAAALAGDPAAHEYLLGWVRCRAWSRSFAEYCKDRGWKRSSAEAGRRRAAAKIAARRRAAGG